MAELRLQFKPQRWHVEYTDNDGEKRVESFASRIVAEEAAGEIPDGIFYLCDCPNRDCIAC